MAVETTAMCTDCGLAVANGYTHQKWHKDQDHNFAQLASALNGITLTLRKIEQRVNQLH